jgi:hypothetical protein
MASGRDAPLMRYHGVAGRELGALAVGCAIRGVPTEGFVEDLHVTIAIDRRNFVSHRSEQKRWSSVTRRG